LNKSGLKWSPISIKNQEVGMKKIIGMTVAVLVVAGSIALAAGGGSCCGKAKAEEAACKTATNCEQSATSCPSEKKSCCSAEGECKKAAAPAEAAAE
jgi:hypothetical protein